jgi:hypothetical protein
MAITLEQDVAYKEMPAGTDWIFTISSTNYSGNYKFKYIADLWIDVGTPGALSIRLKFSPNSTGNGIIDISKILEQYVSSDNLGSEAVVFSNFKGTAATATTQHPIHLTDEFSIATNSAKRLTIRWGEEYSANATDAPTEYPNVLTSSNYFFWNAVSYNNEQRLVSGEYGINVSDWNDRIFTLNTSISNCLTDASADRQYIGDNEYATLSYLNGWYSTGTSTLDRMQVTFKDADNNQLSVITTDVIAGNGGYDGSSDTGLVDANKKIQFAGVGTANMLGAGVTIPSNWAHYEVLFRTGLGMKCKTYHYYKRNADCKGFEKIRLTWLNKYGVWDYYTFTKKNIRSTNIKRAEYSKVKGNWNSSTFTKNGFNRGRGVLSTSATETISLNSDWFSSDDEAAWIEQLFISPEVYILGDYDSNDAGTNGAEYGNYLTPVVVTSKNYDRYTRANDKVAQYELDIEYSINKRIQRA